MPRRFLCAIVACAVPALALAQSAILQGGPWLAGHFPMYGSASSQPVTQDAGPARGGSAGQTPSELAITARGTGTPPYVAQGTGPLGTIACTYDAAIDNPTGYHWLCFSPNASGGALIATGAGGTARAQPLLFSVNGTLITPISCNGAPSNQFAVVSGIVTHC